MPIRTEATSGLTKLVKALSSPLITACLTLVALISSILGISVTSTPAFSYFWRAPASFPDVIANAPFSLANFLRPSIPWTSIIFGKTSPLPVDSELALIMPPGKLIPANNALKSAGNIPYRAACASFSASVSPSPLSIDRFGATLTITSSAEAFGSLEIILLNKVSNAPRCPLVGGANPPV